MFEARMNDVINVHPRFFLKTDIQSDYIHYKRYFDTYTGTPKKPNFWCGIGCSTHFLSIYPYPVYLTFLVSTRTQSYPPNFFRYLGIG